jgi:hypothetical protein
MQVQVQASNYFKKEGVEGEERWARICAFLKLCTSLVLGPSVGTEQGRVGVGRLKRREKVDKAV